MKILIILMTACLMQVSASTYAQRISLSEKNASLISIFQKINKQSGISFLVSNELLAGTKTVNIDVKDEELSDVLENIFKGQPLSFELKDKVVVVSRKEPSFLERIIDRFNAIDVRGVVTDSLGNPLQGATVKVKGSSTQVNTSAKGEFYIANVDENAVLVVSYVGYVSREVKAEKDLGMIRMVMGSADLEEVNIASTGYQKVKPNEVTGSLVVIDNKTLNQQTGTNILKRLEGVTNGVLFDNNKVRNGSVKNNNISIRGLSTINASMEPLIVLDGFIYEGNIDNINPNDIENITVLKDAAATSIWGAKAGNGVIVIVTKKGRFNQNLQADINSNIIITDKPNLFYLPQMSSSDYINVEELLFNKDFSGFYNRINTGYLSLTPAVEVLLKRKNGLITPTDSATQINALKASDARDQFNKYLYRNAVTQQYAANVRGGSNNNAYTVSLGYDNTLGELQNAFQKINIRVDNTYKPAKNVLVNLGVYYTNSKSVSGAPGYGSIRLAERAVPYLKIADNDGTPLSVGTTYRDSYVDTAGAGKLLDWKHYPLEEWKHTKRNTDLQEIFASIGVQYKAFQFLNIDFKYQYQKQHSKGEQLNDLESYYTRNLINTFSQLNRATGVVNYILPLGNIRNISNNVIESHTARPQLNFNHSWADHNIVAIAGGEIRQVKTEGDQFTAYGYKSDPLLTAPVDFKNTYPTFITGASQGISGSPDFGANDYRFVSIYSNASYTYKERYILSASARKDGSNILGVKSNDKWKPLWSVGAGWKISDEMFYKSNIIPSLKLRVSYGFSGNVDPSRSAIPVGNYGTAPFTTFPYAVVRTLNNPELRWEKTGMFNIGMDFSFKNDILTGSVEFYQKKGSDLYGPSQYDYTVWGYTNEVTINAANLEGKGVDVALNGKIINRALKWQTSLLFNYNTNKVTQYYSQSAKKVTAKINAGTGIAPVIGKPIYAIAAYKWGGLDANGNPQGYVNGQLSSDYTAIFKEGDANGVDGNVIYIGPSSPPMFGFLTNTFSWKQLSLSFLISYKLGYYFNKSTISYTTLVNSGIGHKDFEKRWQNTGDESSTNVPSFVFPNNEQRDNFYNTSAVNVLKADHIRFQYINLSYSIMQGKRIKQPFSGIQLYTNVANLGILWRANKESIDPEYPTTLYPSKAWTVGVRATF